MSDVDDYYIDPDDHCVCPNCMGVRVVDCHCGGDLCLCQNYGEKDCPTCGGEGEVTKERYDRYMDNLAAFHAAFRRIMEDSSDE